MSTNDQQTSQLSSDHLRLCDIDAGRQLKVKDETKLTAGTVTPRKRRSRKGLGKQVDCKVEGCGKSYSRAEHLQRHQLNHNTEQVFNCHYPDCSRTFFRSDLLKRHLSRHVGKTGQRKEIQPPLSPDDQIVMSDFAPTISSTQSSMVAGCHYMAQYQYMSPQETSQGSHLSADQSPLNRQTNVESFNTISDNFLSERSYDNPSTPHKKDGNTSGTGSVVAESTYSPYSFSVPSSHPSDFHLGQPQRISTISHSTSTCINEQIHTLSLDMTHAHHFAARRNTNQHDNSHSYVSPESTKQYETSQHYLEEDFSNEQLGRPNVDPVFSNEHKRPIQGGLPEDLMAYLFHAPQRQHSSGCEIQGLSYQCNEFHHTQYSAPHNVTDMALMSQPQCPSQHQRMPIVNLLDAKCPESDISEKRSQQVFDFINNRFHEHDVPPIERQRAGIVGGDRQQDSHILSRRLMQAYLSAFWYQFDYQFPILHRPTFSADETPMLLLLAMMTIGSACLDRTYGQPILSSDANISYFLSRHLRWEIFMNKDFRPPTKLWVFQTLILLELHEKMCSTREMHERAHVHHATTITLMRRGLSLVGIGESSGDSLALHRGDAPNRTKQPDCMPNSLSDERWLAWVANEATRRAAYASFVIDSTHAAMFGHSAVMVTHEIRLPLPCDESLWRARSSAEASRVETDLEARGVQQISFLEGLHRTLTHQEVKTTVFGRTALIAGLMSVAYQMQQRDLQMNLLDNGALQALGGGDAWRTSLTQAYEFWRIDFHSGLEETEPLSTEPSTKHANQAQVIFSSCTGLHHLAHMAMHADIVDCQLFACAKRVLGRTIGPLELNNAQQRVKEQWAPSAEARHATFFALKYLGLILLPDRQAPLSPASAWPEGFYETRYDVILERSWVIYFAALIVWSYGYAMEGPSSEIPQDTCAPEELQHQLRSYLLRYAGIMNPDELQSMRGINNNTALLRVLQDSFSKSHWDLLHEAAQLIGNCIILNSGGSILHEESEHL